MSKIEEQSSKNLELLLSHYAGEMEIIKQASYSMRQLEEYAIAQFGLSTWLQVTNRAPVTEDEGKFTCKPGAPIQATVAYLHDLAKTREETLETEFAGVTLTVNPEQTMEEIFQAWFKLKQEASPS